MEFFKSYEGDKNFLKRFFIGVYLVENVGGGARNIN